MRAPNETVFFEKTILSAAEQAAESAGLAVTLVLAENGINFFFLGAGELFGLFGFAGYRFSGQ
jgi:hypothetical protein